MDNVEGWTDCGIGADQVDAWRKAGFSCKQAETWSAVLEGTYEHDELAVDAVVRVASAWTVAGFTVEQAAKWIDALAWTPPSACPAQAREWAFAGVTADRACAWEGREDPQEAAHFERNDWQPWERDLLLALLDPKTAREMAAGTVPFRSDVSALRRYLVETGIPAGRVLDYAKAGVPILDLDAYERMHTLGGRIDGVLRDLEGRLDRPYGHAYRADLVTAGRGQAFHLRPILGGAPDPFRVEHVPVPPLPRDWTGPAIARLWADQGESTTRIDTECWIAGNAWGREAYPPILSWTDADHRLVEQAFQDALDPGQECSVEWPPVATLRTNGRVTGRSSEPCERHKDAFEASCWRCEAPPEPPTIEPAEFQWHVEVVVRVMSCDGGVRRHETEVQHIASTFLDPRAVEYREVPRQR